MDSILNPEYRQKIILNIQDLVQAVQNRNRCSHLEINRVGPWINLAGLGAQ